MPICFGMLVTLLSWLWNLEALSSRTSVSSRSGARGTSPQAWNVSTISAHTPYTLTFKKVNYKNNLEWLGSI